MSVNIHLRMFHFYEEGGDEQAAYQVGFELQGNCECVVGLKSGNRKGAGRGEVGQT